MICSARRAADVRAQWPAAGPVSSAWASCALLSVSAQLRTLKVRVDKAYYSAEYLHWLRGRNLIARIARPGIESGERLGRHHWKIERSIAWLFGYRRLTVRYERKGSHFLAFIGLAAALTCYKRLAKLST
ncbi:transposase [Streptomyces sp. NPDC048171]|uniref:transposase n=1 Tax=Streptomyces sp. NPDC048171 TaxID=3365504 RepID=UPI00372387E4